MLINFASICSSMAKPWVVTWFSARQNLQKRASTIVLVDNCRKYDCVVHLLLMEYLSSCRASCCLRPSKQRRGYRRRPTHFDVVGITTVGFTVFSVIILPSVITHRVHNVWPSFYFYRWNLMIWRFVCSRTVLWAPVGFHTVPDQFWYAFNKNYLQRLLLVESMAP